MPTPLVSILIPVYNREVLLSDAVASACGQTWTSVEIVIVDNASTDGSFRVASNWAIHDERVRVFRNETNLGPVANWGRCLELARGEYGKFLWSDDAMDPDFVTRTMRALAGYADVGFAATSFQFTGEENHVCHWMDATGVYSGDEYVWRACLSGGGLCSPALALFRLSDLRRFFTQEVKNPFGLDFAGCGAGPDVLFFLEACREYPRFAYLHEPLVCLRAHKAAISAQRRRMVDACYGWALLDFLDRTQPRWSDVRDRLLSRMRVDPRFWRMPQERKFRFVPREAVGHLRFLAREGRRAVWRRLRA